MKLSTHVRRSNDPTNFPILSSDEDKIVRNDFRYQVKYRGASSISSALTRASLTIRSSFFCERFLPIDFQLMAPLSSLSEVITANWE